MQEHCLQLEPPRVVLGQLKLLPLHGQVVQTRPHASAVMQARYHAAACPCHCAMHALRQQPACALAEVLPWVLLSCQKSYTLLVLRPAAAVCAGQCPTAVAADSYHPQPWSPRPQWMCDPPLHAAPHLLLSQYPPPHACTVLLGSGTDHVRLPPVCSCSTMETNTSRGGGTPRFYFCILLQMCSCTGFHTSRSVKVLVQCCMHSPKCQTMKVPTICLLTTDTIFLSSVCSTVPLPHPSTSAIIASGPTSSAWCRRPCSASSLGSRCAWAMRTCNEERDVW